MARLKELRKQNKESSQTVAKTAKLAKSDMKINQFSQFSHPKQLELKMLKDERAAIREYDGGMSRKRAEYYSVLDIPSLPE